MVRLDLVDQLESLGAEIQSHLGTPPRALLFPLAGQVPGPYIPEHDERIKAAALCFTMLNAIGWSCRILCSGGTADIHGLTVARYMANQIDDLLKGPEGHLDWEADLSIIIGKEKSGHTAQNIHLSRNTVLNSDYDLVVLISNGPHLCPAGAYFRQLIPEMPFVKWSSGNGRGCLNWPYPLYLLRELLHYLAAITFDRNGQYLDQRTEKLVAKWKKLTFPTIPPPP